MTGPVGPVGAMGATLATLATLAALGTAASADPIKVAVVPGRVTGLDPARADALAQDLADALAAELEVDAIGGPEVSVLLPPEGVPPGCASIPTCVADVARRTGADQLLFVALTAPGSSGAILVDPTLVEPISSQSSSRPRIELRDQRSAIPRFAAAARLLIPTARARPKPTGSIALGPQLPRRHLTTWSTITAGVAVGGLGLGIGFGLVTRSRYDACAAQGPACSTADRDAIRPMSAVADLGFGLAVGGAIATTVMYLQSGESSHLTVAPTPEGIAVTAIGRF